MTVFYFEHLGGMSMKKIIIDAGHGGKDSGAVGHGLKEKDVTLAVSLAVRDRLVAHGFEVVLLRDSDVFVGDASERGAKIKTLGGDYALSIHVNAGGGVGAEIITPCKEAYGNIEYYMAEALKEVGKFRKIYSRDYTTGATYNRTINAKTLKYDNVYNKTDYYGVIRGAGTVSTDIVELFFIDTESDVKTYQNNKDGYVEAIVKGIVKGFGVTYQEPVKTPPTATTEAGEVFYQVICGSYKNKETAEALADQLTKEGYKGVWINRIVK